MKVDGRARARPLCATFGLFWAALLFVALGGCSEEKPRDPAAERSVSPRPAAPACELDEAAIHPGSSPALAAGAIVLRQEGAYRLLPLEGEARPLDARWISPRGLARHGDGWIALASTSEGPALLTVGAEVGTIALGSGALVDGALAVQGDRAVAAWTDDTRALRVARVDLARKLATAPVVLDDTVQRRPLAAPTPEGAIVTAPDAPLYDVGQSSANRRRAPGLVVGLASTEGGTAVLHRSPDRTGLWLSVGDAPAVLATEAGARAASPSLAALPGGMLLAYRSGADVVIQRLHPNGEPSGAPQVAGVAGDRASAPLVATEGERVWIAWESTGEDGTKVHVRAGTCPSSS